MLRLFTRQGVCLAPRRITRLHLRRSIVTAGDNGFPERGADNHGEDCSNYRPNQQRSSWNDGHLNQWNRIGKSDDRISGVVEDHGDLKGDASKTLGEVKTAVEKGEQNTQIGTMHGGLSADIEKPLTETEKARTETEETRAEIEKRRTRVRPSFWQAVGNLVSGFSLAIGYFIAKWLDEWFD